MRYLIMLVLMLGGTATGALGYHDFTLGPPVILAAPTQVQLTTAGAPILPGGWTNSPSLTFGAHAPSGISARLDVEVQSRNHTFTGTPTATSSTLAGAPTLTTHLADGNFRWQLRLHDDHGVSPWVANNRELRVDTQPPSITGITSPTDPDTTKLYHASTATFQWQANDAGSGIAGYSYRLDKAALGEARAELRTPQPTVTLSGLDTGKWYFHVRAADHAGNWGPTVTMPIRIDVTPPGLAHVRFNHFQFDPQFDALRVSFAVTRPTSSVRVGVYRQRTNSLVRLYKLGKLPAGGSTTVWWDGKDSSGKPVPADAYSVYVRPSDSFGHSKPTGWRDFIVDYRRIVVSLGQQRLTAFDGNHQILTTLVTTGNRELPTPTGTYHIMARFRPFTFISPWPKTSPYYYKPSKSQYALLFREGGYFIHDAPWRTAYGPGTNAAIGTPGQNFTGTHGCVNTPPDAARALFNWARIGTVVQVVP